MESGIHTELATGRPKDAAILARRVLEVDPMAEHIERLLLRAYHESGSPAAVREQYGHYASVLRDSLGVEPPTLTELIESKFQEDEIT